MRNVFVLGLDDFHRALLEGLPHRKDCVFHGLLGRHEFRSPESIPIADLMERSRAALESFPGSVDAILGYWDFPISCMAPMLCAERNLPSVSLDSVVRCEHKLWSRLLQRDIVPEHVPRFCAVDPFDDAALSKIDLDFPFWLKPIKSWNAYLGFRIDGPVAFQRHIARLRAEIGKIARAFDYVLDRVDLPAEIAPFRGQYCIAEEIISTGNQCTLEGYVYDGEVHGIGIVDSIHVPGRSTFARYQYPSMLPRTIQVRIEAIAKRLMSYVRFDGGHFNVEFFWNPESDRLAILEVNARISQSHSDLFEKVDGQPNHAIALDLALGRQPHFPTRRGRYPCAAKFYYRQLQDALVTAAPDEERIRQICREIPGVRIDNLVRAGTRLSDLTGQESYSYEVAWIYVGGADEAELITKYHAVVERLGYEFQTEHAA